MRWLLLLVLTLVGCSGSRQGATVEGQPGAPDRASCVVDDDCVAAPLTSPDLCCDTGVPAEVVSRAFDEWRRATRARRCEGVVCPAIPSPTPPRACAVEPRCVAGQCAHSCDDVGGPRDEPAADRATEGASDALRDRVVVARLDADGRWLRVEATSAGLVGCEVPSAETACPASTEARPLGRGELRELDERWANVHRRGNCRAARIDDTAWTPIRVSSTRETIDARAPADPESLHPPECFSLQHLVGWMTRQWLTRGAR
ncbi:MAG: hypothetical protein KF901_07330 [Myxococcales bacterium]|nr:hypothetical protein [Myxococcales bacterium]